MRFRKQLHAEQRCERLADAFHQERNGAAHPLYALNISDDVVDGLGIRDQIDNHGTFSRLDEVVRQLPLSLDSAFYRRG